jgi:hypothetical protein
MCGHPCNRRNPLVQAYFRVRVLRRFSLAVHRETRAKPSRFARVLNAQTGRVE